jgi:hypothetical protein
MNAMHTDNTDAEELEVYHMRKNELLSMISGWLDEKFAHRKTLRWIRKAPGLLLYLWWTEDMQATLKACVDRYTSEGTYGAWRVQ